MDTIAIGRQFDKLSQRREQLRGTLRHLAKQHAEVARNTDWLDRAAYENRVKLLERLNDWYRAEIAAIDRALTRIEERRYGLCGACQQPIDARRLAMMPETELCAPCNKIREQVVRC